MILLAPYGQLPEQRPSSTSQVSSEGLSVWIVTQCCSRLGNKSSQSSESSSVTTPPIACVSSEVRTGARAIQGIAATPEHTSTKLIAGTNQSDCLILRSTCSDPPLCFCATDPWLLFQVLLYVVQVCVVYRIISSSALSGIKIRVPESAGRLVSGRAVLCSISGWSRVSSAFRLCLILTRCTSVS